MNRERFGGTAPDEIVISKHFLTAPDEHGPLQDIKISVPSLNDSWLISRDRKPEDINVVLEGRLQGIQLALQSSENNILKDRWNINGPISGALSRTIAYAEMLDEYRTLQEFKTQKLDGLEIEFQNTQEELRAQEERKQINSHEQVQKTTKERKQVDETKYASSISLERDKRVRKLILNNAVNDYLNYSDGGSDSLTNLQGLISALERYDGAEANNLYAQNAITHLVSSMSDSLSNPNNSELYRRLRYKPTSSPIKTFAEAAQLRQFMLMRFDPESVSKNPDTYSTLRSFSQAYFEFHQRRTLLASKHTPEYIPFLSLIHDMAAVASTSGNTRFIEQVKSYLNNEFNSNMGSKIAKREIETLVTDTIADTEEFFSLATRPTVRFETANSVAVDNEELERFNKLIHRDSWTLGSGLLTLETASKVQGSATGWTGLRILEPLRVAHRTEAARMNIQFKKKYNDLLLHQASMAYATLPFQFVEESKSLELNLLSAVTRLDKNYPQMASSSTLNELQRRLDDLWGKGKDSQLPKPKRLANFYKQTVETGNINKRGIAELIREYTNLYWDNSQTEEEQSEERERHGRLWREILDNSEWFVSPRGDRFLAKDDPEMRNKGIESVTFRIDRTRPREHVVQVLLQGIPNHVTLWLDTERNMLFDTHPFTQEWSRSPLLIDLRAKLQFGSFILKRLYAITSGMYKQEQEGGRSDYEGNEPEIYRRACYLRYGPGFHLTSETALQHKREIKQEYNIDLDMEQRRRREIGTLSHNEKLSFRRETVPARLQGTYIPNILTYDPTRIAI